MRVRSRHFAAFAAAAAIALGFARPAMAQNANDKAAAEALFDQGKTLMAAGNYAAACPKFSESLRLDAGVGTSLWLAECYERSGKTASAWAQFREAAATAVRNGDPREKIARERAARLEPGLAKLIILVPKNAASATLKVTRDGEEVGRPLWGTPVPIDPGEHTLAATDAGKKTWSTVTYVAASPNPVSVAVPVLDDAPGQPPAPEGERGVASGNDAAAAGAERPSSQPVRDPGFRAAGLTVGAAGVVGVGVGAAFGLVAISKLNASNSPSDGGCRPATPHDICNSTGLTERSAAQSAATASTIGFVVGGAAIAGGALLYFLAPKVEPKAASARIVPLAGPGGAGLAVSGAW